MKINRNQIQFLLGIDNMEALCILRDSLLKQGFSKSDIKGNEYIEVSKICRRSISYSDAFNGKNIIELTITNLKKYGISESIKREILESTSCILKADLVGKYSLLKKNIIARPDNRYQNLFREAEDRVLKLCK